jgi:hypothetical protein
MFPFILSKKNYQNQPQIQQGLQIPEQVHTNNHQQIPMQQMDNNYNYQQNSNYNNNNDLPPSYSNVLIKYRHTHTCRFFGIIIICISIFIIIGVTSSIFSTRRNRYY